MTRSHSRPMRTPLVIALAGALAVAPFAAFSQDDAKDTAADRPLTAANEVSSDTIVDADASAAGVLRAQVLLERAHFSPGEIDGRWGSNTRRAIDAFQRRHDLDVTGKVDKATWEALGGNGVEVLTDYTITAADLKGPFKSIPSDMEAKAKLDRLGFTSPLEALGEKFHSRPRLLEQLNPDRKLAEGETWRVPNVSGIELPKGSKVVVDKSDVSVALVDESGKIVGRWPATMGSQHDPLPIGEWTIKGVAPDPVFHYNPDLFWDSSPGDEKAKIPPGPNNPVGVVWIDLSKEHYGIHGTPEPTNIGKTQSHGCIRMTNWSARALSEAVSPGTTAVLQE
ncbi:L,D-transpeptidase family protein [Novilysobacter spongiicola]|uniref:Lipoprotein-anchoring transpeptidase ErfK/SrfK n=1 Tax=Lysobacter spongiicola DSM 21749 TaxID=1122188 RepID=A0A1T4QPQ2_9GAMM|nr:L,D-transpeptidase [Lysobacter spongiicola]SKA05441.1 Lipoprotein-anchoring transpeptidase ErfK/SrfK [Lysobacter spongiicola DSM 21749]